MFENYSISNLFQTVFSDIPFIFSFKRLNHCQEELIKTKYIDTISYIEKKKIYEKKSTSADYKNLNEGKKREKEENIEKSKYKYSFKYRSNKYDCIIFDSLKYNNILSINFYFNDKFIPSKSEDILFLDKSSSFGDKKVYIYKPYYLYTLNIFKYFIGKKKLNLNLKINQSKLIETKDEKYIHLFFQINDMDIHISFKNKIKENSEILNQDKIDSINFKIDEIYEDFKCQDCDKKYLQTKKEIDMLKKQILNEKQEISNISEEIKKNKEILEEKLNKIRGVNIYNNDFLFLKKFLTEFENDKNENKNINDFLNELII